MDGVSKAAKEHLESRLRRRITHERQVYEAVLSKVKQKLDFVLG